MYLSGYKYFETSPAMKIYAGFGIGTIYNEQRKDMCLWMLTNDGWQFAMAPELGVLVPVNSSLDLILRIKYNYGLETSSMPAFSSLGINLGFLF